ncbi:MULTISPECIES: hypothetical protein [unclassified Ensifer]|nr:MULTISPECIES: hypothetical protein [unclassified Ensifer]
MDPGDEPIQHMALKAATKNGFVVLSLCRNASGIMVQPLNGDRM